MTPSIDIVLDGAARSVEEGTTGTSLFASERDVVAMRVDGEPWDLDRRLPAGAVVEPIAMSSDIALRKARSFATLRGRTDSSP